MQYYQNLRSLLHIFNTYHTTFSFFCILHSYVCIILSILGMKILIVCFELHLNTEWYRIARTIRDMGNRQDSNSALWRFLDFAAMHRGSLYTLLLPFIHTRLQLPGDDTDVERHFQSSTKDRISGNVIQNGRSKTVLLTELGTELGEMRSNLNKRLQGMFCGCGL